MKVFNVIVVITLIISSFALAQQSGNLFIQAMPGYRVYVDGDLAGFTNKEEDGILIRGVSLGRKNIKLIKAGSEEKILSAEVIAGRTIEIIVEEEPQAPLRYDGVYYGLWRVDENLLSADQYVYYCIRFLRTSPEITSTSLSLGMMRLGIRYQYGFICGMATTENMNQEPTINAAAMSGNGGYNINCISKSECNIDIGFTFGESQFYQGSGTVYSSGKLRIRLRNSSDDRFIDFAFRPDK